MFFLFCFGCIALIFVNVNILCRILLFYTQINAINNKSFTKQKSNSLRRYICYNFSEIFNKIEEPEK